MKKKDIILGLTIITVGLILMLMMKVYHHSEGNRIVIEVNGKKYGTYSLDENQEINVDTEYGHNVICIEAGKAYMKEADCPDGYCMRQGKISKKNQTIVCLPHKLVVEVNGEQHRTSKASDNENSASDIVPDAVVK